MYNYIILSSSLFGSIYIFSISLGLINMSVLKNKKIPPILFVVNGLTFLITGSVIVYCISNLKLSNF
jgi:hypothetical protein